MNHKNLLILFTLLTSVFYYSFVADCYHDWLDAYETATITYTANLTACDQVLFGWDLCDAENELAYTQSINEAGEEFHCCVIGC